MLLAIDASRAAAPQKTGVGWYCYHLLQHLNDVIPDDVGVVLYSDQPLSEELRPWPRNWTERVLEWPASSFKLQASSSRWPLWSQIRLADRVLRDRPDIFFVPAHVIPLGLSLAPRSKRPTLITTIHDVVFKPFPESYPIRERWYADHSTRLAVRHADRIIVPTQAVKEDLERYYRCESEKVVVIHHGITPTSSSRGACDEGSHKFVQRCHDVRSLVPTAVGARDDTTGRTILYVGRLERKKNVGRMVEAFTNVAGNHPDLHLILAGPPGYGYEEIRAAIDRSPVRERISETGWVDQGQYRQLLSSASVFLFPTLGEGFGLPILEAMAAGVPVITSNGGAHEEVAGDAAVLVNPESTDAIAEAILRVLENVDLRSSLVHRGQRRAAQFTWNQAAQETWDVLWSVLSS